MPPKVNNMSWKEVLKGTEKEEVFEKNKEKPDYIDLDKDGNTTEPMKEAAKDAKKKKKPKSKNPFTRED